MGREMGFFCIRSENRLEYTHFIASKVKRFQVIHYRKDVEQHYSITCKSAHRIDLSYL
jgi:hypothetical protein